VKFIITNNKPPIETPKNLLGMDYDEFMKSIEKWLTIQSTMRRMSDALEGTIDEIHNYQR